MSSKLSLANVGFDLMKALSTECPNHCSTKELSQFEHGVNAGKQLAIRAMARQLISMNILEQSDFDELQGISINK